jgi:hypothetical protein
MQSKARARAGQKQCPPDSQKARGQGQRGARPPERGVRASGPNLPLTGRFTTSAEYLALKPAGNHVQSTNIPCQRLIRKIIAAVMKKKKKREYQP